jgi:hypothetical protein
MLDYERRKLADGMATADCLGDFVCSSQKMYVGSNFGKKAISRHSANDESVEESRFKYWRTS